MKISVIIPTFNRREVLARTLPTVLAQNFDDFEVIVVVDGSSDGTAEMLRQLHPACQLRIIEQPNRGRSAARNAGLRAAEGSIVVLLDDDLLCEPDLLREHWEAHQDGPPHVTLGPNLYKSPGGRQTIAMEWARQCSETWMAHFQAGAAPQWPQHAEVDANNSAPRDLLLENPFDEKLDVVEGFDLGFRLWKRTGPFRFMPKAIAWHLAVKPVEALVQRDAPAQGRQELLLCRKHPEYRPYSVLARIQEGSWIKRTIRELTARMPVSPEPLFRIPIRLAEVAGSPQALRMGVRLLQFQQAVPLWRSASRAAGGWHKLRSEFGARLPVLLYHNIGECPQGQERELYVPRHKFKRQMQWLRDNRYTPILTSDWLAWRSEGKSLPDKPVLITFDDAYADLIENAFPVLRRLGFSATVFVPTQALGRAHPWGAAPVMTAEQIRHWSLQGIEFGGHSRTHADLRQLRGRELEDEIGGCAADLAAITGTPPAAFAYPYGFVDAQAEECVRRHFHLAFTVGEGVNNLHTAPHLLHRTMVQPTDSLLTFSNRVKFGFSPWHRFRAWAGLRTRIRRAWATWREHDSLAAKV